MGKQLSIVMVCIALVTSSRGAWGQAETKQAEVTWGRPAARGAGYVPLSAYRKVRFGPAKCPIAIVGQEVWNLKTGEGTGVKLTEPIEKGTLVAISPDGTLICTAVASAGQKDVAVTIWSAETGKKVVATSNR